MIELKFKNILITFIVLFIYNGVLLSENDSLIYNAGVYKWYRDKIVQDIYQGTAISDSSIISNYKSYLKLNQKLNTSWKQTNNISLFPMYKSSFLLENAIYNMGVDEMIKAVEPDLTFRTGELWSGVWTRDVSYSTILSIAYMFPTIAKNSLLRKINMNGRIIQDTGTGGSWPCSTDRLIWVIAAWEIYKVTGDYDWIKAIYPVVKNSVDDNMAMAIDKETGLAMGESSFIDWREQSYPSWMQPADIYKSKCLGTNAIHFQSLKIVSRIAGILHKEEDQRTYNNRAEELKIAINKYFWIPERGYYSQFLYGRNTFLRSYKSETLGEALCILFDIPDQNRCVEMVRSLPVVPLGPTVFYPQIPNIPAYHNDAIWPFVTSFWTIAASKAENGKSIIHSIGSVYRAAALFATNKENFEAQNGDCQGTEINSGTMLWSLSGELGIVFRLFFGINFEEKGIEFRPIVPANLEANRSIKNFRYRNSILNINIKGFGSHIKTFLLDNNATNPFISCDLSGTHNVDIVLENNNINNDSIHIVQNKFSLETPIVRIKNDTLIWNAVKDAVSYIIMRNGKRLKIQNGTEFKLNRVLEGEYQVIATNKDPDMSSFASEPVTNYHEVKFYSLDSITIRKKSHSSIVIPVEITNPGQYAVDFLYSNGNGSVKTNNKCAIRSLLLDGDFCGGVVFPQRGDNDWSSKGWSNSLKINLKEGKHSFRLIFQKENENMNMDINDAVLYQMRFIRIK